MRPYGALLLLGALGLHASAAAQAVEAPAAEAVTSDVEAREGAASLAAPRPASAHRVPFAADPAPSLPTLSDLPTVPYDPPPPARHRSRVAVVAEAAIGAVGTLAGLSPLYLDALHPLLAIGTLPVGITLGVMAGGALAGGDGHVGAVLAGQALGGLGAVPFVVYGDSLVALLGVALLPLVGAVVGYEVSNEVPRRPAEE